MKGKGKFTIFKDVQVVTSENADDSIHRGPNGGILLDKMRTFWPSGLACCWGQLWSLGIDLFKMQRAQMTWGGLAVHFLGAIFCGLRLDEYQYCLPRILIITYKYELNISTILEIKCYFNISLKELQQEQLQEEFCNNVNFKKCFKRYLAIYSKWSEKIPEKFWLEKFKSPLLKNFKNL